MAYAAAVRGSHEIQRKMVQYSLVPTSMLSAYSSYKWIPFVVEARVPVLYGFIGFHSLCCLLSLIACYAFPRGKSATVAKKSLKKKRS